eukprot:36370-Rhodomonas_salina.1
MPARRMILLYPPSLLWYWRAVRLYCILPCTSTVSVVPGTAPGTTAVSYTHLTLPTICSV